MTHAAFAAHLAALSSEEPTFVDGARVLDHSDALGAILNEIDAAILSTAMTFHTERGALSVLVTGRRLHMITAGAPDDVLDRALDPDDGALIKSAAQTLQDFAADAVELRVAHAPVAAHEASMSGRVSVQKLNAALGRYIDDPDASPYDRFLTRMTGDITAAIHLKNKAAQDMTGSSADLAQLKIVISTQLSAFIDARSENCPSHSDPSLTLLRDVTAPGVTLGLAIFGEQAVLFSLPTSEVAKASQSFSQVL
ncbi:hypothetical protein [uncultured Tateyamaria sp.]|uniref:hypothetical protein n=1 Tax=uncultured Tateyamaria sp. TaxID=455651 RepID=UPI00262F3B20|nr:hypothetical protein [uncultured Tateyamaria sp.]